MSNRRSPYGRHLHCSKAVPEQGKKFGLDPVLSRLVEPATSADGQFDRADTPEAAAASVS